MDRIESKPIHLSKPGNERQIHRNMKRVLRDLNLSNRSISDFMEMDDSTFDRFINGKNSYTRLEHLECFAQALGVSIAAIYYYHLEEVNLAFTAFSVAPSKATMCSEQVNMKSRLELELEKSQELIQQLQKTVQQSQAREDDLRNQNDFLLKRIRNLMAGIG